LIGVKSGQISHVLFGEHLGHDDHDVRAIILVAQMALVIQKLLVGVCRALSGQRRPVIGGRLALCILNN
jgi:hypothetical protein